VELHLPKGSRGLDAGCGIGLQAILLSEAIGSAGHVTGLDLSPAFLRHAEKTVNGSGLSDQITFQEGDISNLPFDDDVFDWAWSADCVGYGAWEPLPLLRELARVVKPGGTVAIAAWSSENLLPGYPRLEARLRATSAGIAPFAHGRRPETHFLRALSWFRELGLDQLTAKAFADGFHAPLSPGVRNALVDLLDMRWPEAASELSSDDQAEFRRLCLPDSPDFILNLPDYCMFLTYTLFWGRIAG